MIDKIIVKGAREHNLKDISLEIPRNKLIVITGLSGSGKSSLAFDTIYAEGQRRYVESLSAYARQFLGQMKKPEVDLIDGLSPAISIEQKSTHRNPRSTVGTVTEIYDYFRLLYARIGVPYCYKCGQKISSQTIDQIIDSILTYQEGTKIQILAPMVRGKKGEHHDKISWAKKNGFFRARIDNEIYDLTNEPKLKKNIKHSIDLVIDRIVIKDKIRSRLTDSVETAMKIGSGLVTILTEKKEKLFSSNFSCPDCEISIPELSPRLFSFNSPYGACSKCSGLGFIMQFDPDKIISDPSLSLYEGVLEVWGKNTSYWYLEQIKSLEKSFNFNASLPWKKLPAKIKSIILYGSGQKKINFAAKRSNSEFKFTREFEGVIPNLERRYKETSSDYIRTWMEGFMTNKICEECQGNRLKKESLAVKVVNKRINELTALSIQKANHFFEKLNLKKNDLMIAKQIIKEIKARLKFLNDVGLNYLTLDRAAGTLSGGEAQRIRLATQIGSNLTGVLYVLDEPSIGLHQRDNQKLLTTLKHLRDIGNTVIIVEHDEETIREADYIIDLGPGAGLDGGYLVASGSPKDIAKNKNSITGDYLSGKKKIPIPPVRREAKTFIELKGAQENNLKNIDVKFPLEVLTAVTGISGSGKSTLINEILYKALASLIMKSKKTPGFFRKISGTEQIDKIIEINQAPIGRTPRSNPATYTGLFTVLRDLFAKLPEAKLRGYQPGRFSFNVKGGRCENCQGEGVKKIEMHFLADVYITCDVCQGKRYNQETLEVRYKGKNIYDVLEMSVKEAYDFFENIPGARNRLATLKEVGLEYIKLGQAATTLSGGEAQRVKLATELSKKATGKTLYILDEPTTGLHFEDIKKLINVLKSLVDKKNSVIVIEHNLDVIKTADWIIDLGPEGGENGGKVIASGTPEEITQNKQSSTGLFLKKILKN